MRRVLFLSLMAALTWPVAAASAATPTLTAVSPGLARTDGGTVLTLRGTGFTAGLTVLIDSVPATVFPVSFNTTQVVVVAPPHVVGGATVTVTKTPA